MGTRRGLTITSCIACSEPLLPAAGNTGGRGGRPEKHPRRRVLDAIFYLARGGIAWAALPREFPPHQTVYGLFGRWARAGAWQAVHDALRDLVRVHEGRDPAPTAAIIDSQSVRGADTVPGRSRGYDAGKKVNGRKRHIAVDTCGLLLAVLVTGAGVQDRDGARPLLWALHACFPGIRLVWADSGYTGQLVAWAADQLKLTLQIVAKLAGQTTFVVLHRRWAVERTFSWINRCRRTVRDYERLPEHHAAMVQWAMIIIMTRRLARHQHT